MSRSPSRPPLPRAFWVLWTGTLINRVGTFVEPFLVLYLTSQRGLTPAQAGIVLTAYGAGALVSQILGGALADHVGRRTTLIGGLLASALSLLALGAARGTTELLLAAFVVGVVGDLYRPASSALVADLVDPVERPRAYGLLFWAINLGFMVAAATAGFLAEQSYTLIFVLDATPAPPTPWSSPSASGTTRPDGSSDSAHQAGFRTALADRTFMALCGLTLVHAALYMQGTITLPIAIVDAGLSPADYGLIAALNGLLIVVLQPWVSNRLVRADRMRWMALAQTVMAVGFGLTIFAATVATFAASVAVWTLGEILMAGLLVATVADLAPPEARGRYQGVFGTSFGGALLVAPFVGTRVYQELGADALWLGCLLVGLLVAAGFLALRPALERRMPTLDPGPGGVTARRLGQRFGRRVQSTVISPVTVPSAVVSSTCTSNSGRTPASSSARTSATVRSSVAVAVTGPRASLR